MADATSANAQPANPERAAFDCLAGGGEMGALMRAMNWAATPLGPVEQWPQSLRSAVSICLGSRFPILVWWGPQLVMLYNDAYRPILGTTKHPQALGQTGRACWPEIWHIIGPMLEETVLAQGQAIWSDDQMLLLDRNNYLEECYFTFSYSPIRDESGSVGGVFCVVTETTERVIGERRLSTLRELAAHASDARTAERAGQMAIETLANNPADLPFALLYLLDADRQHATLAGVAGLTPSSPYRALHQALAEQRNLVQEHYYAPMGRWFENRIYAAPDGVTVFASDISDRKAAEAELRASEERFAKAFHASPQPMCINRIEDGGYIDANESFARMVGYPRTEIISRTSLDIGIWTDPEERIRTIERILRQGGGHNFEHHFHDHNGKLHEIVSSGQLIELGGRLCILSVIDDVTERKQAEAALRASEERFSKAFHASPQPMSITRFDDGTYIDVNNSFAQMLGYERAEILGRTSLDTGLWQEPTARRAANELLRNQGGHRDYEHRFRNRNGEWRELQAAAELIELGGQLCILNVAIDITARKQAEEELVRAREQAEQTANRIARLQQVTAALTGAATSQQLAEAVIRQGAQATGAAAGMLVELMDNGQSLRVIAAHGYPAAVVQSKPVPLAAPTPMSDCIRTGKAIWIQSQQNFATLYPSLSQLRGSFGYEATAAIPLIVGERRLGGLAFSFDEPRELDREEREFFLAVAQQCAQAFERARLYEAEQTARAAADVAADRITRLQTITAELAVALTPTQVVDVIVYQGIVALDAIAITVKLLSDDGQWLEMVDSSGFPPEVMALYQRYPISTSNPLADAVRTGAPIWLESEQAYLERYPHLAKDIIAVGFEAACAIPLLVGSRILGGIGVSFAHEVGFNTEEQRFLLTLARQCAQALERARLYELEQQARVELEARVRERTAELERSNRELDQFAYVASHDLKSPLRGIEHLANFLLQDVGTALPEASQRHLSLIQSRIKRMEALLDDLLAYSRAGRHRYAAERLDLAAIIADMVELLAPPPGFVVEINEPLPVVVGERVPFELIFRNLIGNAIKHHHRPSEGVVRIRAYEHDDWIEVSVADNGPGIDPAFHERIFEIFQTLKPRDQVEGSGIGLTVVKKMVETRGGAIWLESTPGKGTTFYCTWPKNYTM